MNVAILSTNEDKHLQVVPLCLVTLVIARPLAARRGARLDVAEV